MIRIRVCGVVLAAIAMVGCADDPVPAPLYEPSDIENHTLTQITSGQNDHIMWECQRDSVSHNSVWIDCSFKNGSTQPDSVCINVYYGRDHSFAYTDNKVCSGVIAPGGTKEANAAFDRKKRIALDELCGADILGCTLYTVEREVSP